MSERKPSVWLATAGLLVAFIAACGTDEPAASVRAADGAPTADQPGVDESGDDERGQTGGTLPPFLEEQPEPPPVPSIEPIEARLENTNERDGGLGSLCWARWEVARLLIQSSTTVDLDGTPGSATTALTTLESQLPTIGSELIQVVEQVPPEVREFAIRLRDDVAASTSSEPAVQDDVEQRVAQLGAFFDFESYPGLTDYGRLAADYPGCPRP